MKAFSMTTLILSLAITSNVSLAQISSLSDEELKLIQSECELEAKDYDLKGDEKAEFVASCIADLSPENETQDLDEYNIDEGAVEDEDDFDEQTESTK